MDELVEEITPDVERLLQSGALKANSAARRTFDAIFGDEGSVRFPTSAQALMAASRRIRGKTTVDNVRLSRRIWRAHRAAGDQMAKTITASLQAGDSMAKTADKILEARQPQLAIPKYIREMEEAARKGGDEYQRVLNKHKPRIEKLGAVDNNLSMRPIVQQLQKELEDARPAQIDKAINRYVTDRARNHTRMIARTEAVEAYRDSYRRSTEDQDWTKGYRWALSSSHPAPCECEILAGQDLYGLGPGGYPVDRVPPTPHPNCMCIQSAIIDRDHFKRSKAERNDEPPPAEKWKSGKRERSAEWLQRQSEKKQKAILGPTKFEIFQETPEKVLGRYGVPKRVKTILRSKK
jgi:hypothetical protein